MLFSGARRNSRLRSAQDLAAAAAHVCQMSPSQGTQTLKCVCHMPSDQEDFTCIKSSTIMVYRLGWLLGYLLCRCKGALS